MVTGLLFANQAEPVGIMQAIATALESAGHQTYLPQRDGLEAKELTKYLGQHAGGDDKCEHNTTLATVEKLARAFDLSVIELLRPHAFKR